MKWGFSKDSKDPQKECVKLMWDYGNLRRKIQKLLNAVETVNLTDKGLEAERNKLRDSLISLESNLVIMTSVTTEEEGVQIKSFKESLVEYNGNFHVYYKEAERLGI